MTRMIVAGVGGLVLTLWLLYGVALLLERQRRSPVIEQLARRQTPREGAARRTHRMRASLQPRRAPLKQAAAVLRRKKKKKKKPVEKLDGQVVETARPEREERPRVAKYLGRYDMKVPVERKSRGHKRKSRDLGTVDVKKPSRLQSPDSRSREQTSIPASMRRAKQRAARGEKEREAVAAKRPGEGAPADGGVTRRGPGALKGGGAQRKERPRPSVVLGASSRMLLPATSPGNILHNIQALAGSPGSDDYLPDVLEEGDTNLLNTRKFRYWDFFQRVKERVRSEWSPASVWRQRDPTGKRYGVRDRLTVVRVTLDPDGALKQIRVARRSGLSFLDDEATRAFTAAGPYPNPPTGLKNAAGEVEFKFGFMFEISSARFRFYRVRN